MRFLISKLRIRIKTTSVVAKEEVAEAGHPALLHRANLLKWVWQSLLSARLKK
jgi:hypothetical protein